MIFATSPHFFLTSLAAFFPLERSVQRSGVCPLTNLLATHKIFIFYYLIYYLNIFISLSCMLIYILFQYIKSIVPWTVLLSFTIIYPVYNFISFSCILIHILPEVLFQYTLLSKVLFHEQYFCPSLLYMYIYRQKYCPMYRSSILYYQKYCSIIYVYISSWNNTFESGTFEWLLIFFPFMSSSSLYDLFAREHSTNWTDDVVGDITRNGQIIGLIFA